MGELETTVKAMELRPLVSTKQVAWTCTVILGSVFAAGAWANNIQVQQTQLKESQNTTQATLKTIDTKLERLSQVDRIQDRMERMERELDRLREEQRTR